MQNEETENHVSLHYKKTNLVSYVVANSRAYSWDCFTCFWIRFQTLWRQMNLYVWKMNKIKQFEYLFSASIFTLNYSSINAGVHLLATAEFQRVIESQQEWAPHAFTNTETKFIWRIWQVTFCYSSAWRRSSKSMQTNMKFTGYDANLAFYRHIYFENCAQFMFRFSI